jgi:uncharacterized protein YjbI with pentapeptide repeats
VSRESRIMEKYVPNKSHLQILERGVAEWNKWRAQNPAVVPSLRRADLAEASLAGVDFNGADLRVIDLSGADLRGAKLRKVNLYRSSLWHANLTDADLSDADLSSSNLNGAILSGTDVTRANLRFCRMTAADVSEATFSGSHVYGSSLWNLKGTPKEQFGVVITPPSESPITVDDLEVAQFIYVLLNNRKVRNVLDTITSKVVLILGRFTPDRKAVLDAIRSELRNRNYLPVMFDFEKPSNQTTLEAVSTLAHMARFVIADLTDAKSVLQELQSVVPASPSVPIQPILLASQEEPGMFDFFHTFPWVLRPHFYENKDQLLMDLADKVIAPAEEAKKKCRP